MSDEDEEEELFRILATKGCNNSKGTKCIAGDKKTRSTRVSICAGTTCKIHLS